ncbi:MAG: transglutaminase domain-containing protein [Candidatus Diapherotrites archaeon]|uniref:Transglutaminase domain-containing protein n=1 Tax=Candidatus Iainarchaeum sp. TaxID=3101447 RepID=A0A8T4L6R2_9ARCH|nr:transglutaminase domain-containing protein [Candidatus Diapherotrites archaeon]
MRVQALALCLVVLLFLLGPAAALTFRPATVQSMDLTVNLKAEGAFSGTVYEGDRLEIKFLTLNNSNTQQIQEMDEKLIIGGREFRPTYKLEGSNKYAVYTLDELMDYAATPKFTIVSKARVKTLARMDSLVDYDLGKPMKGLVEEFLRPSAYIEADDPELVSKARLEFSSTSSELETIRQITEWVNKNVTYDFENYYNGVWGAKDTYASRRGVCDEFSNLAAAFLRAKGIPTMYVSGVSFDGERFGNHGWLEVYLGGKGWIGVDPTYGEAGYLDAAHLVLGKGLDANLLSNFSATTLSRKSIQVKAVLHDPVIEINDIQFFEDIVDVQVEKPEKLGLNQEFEVRVRLKSRQDSTTIIPVELVLHEEFKQEDRGRLVMLKPFEEKWLTWKAVSPVEGLEGQYARYGMVFLAPDQNVEDTLVVYPTRSLEKGGPQIEAIDVSPFISEEGVKLELVLENRGLGVGDVEITFKYYGVEQKARDTLEPGDQKRFAFEANFAKPGTMSLEINDGLAVKAIEIEVPQQAVEAARDGERVRIEERKTRESPLPTPPESEAERAWKALEREAGALVEAVLANEGTLYALVGGLALLLILLVLKSLVRR